MAGRKTFSDCEKSCLQELIIKYKLNSTTTSTCGNSATKKQAWVRLVEEFNSIETNTKRTEAQLKKLWDNLKTRKKAALSQEKRDRMRTGGGSFVQQPSTSIVLLDDALLEPTDVELRDVLDSDQTTQGVMSLPEGQDLYDITVDDVIFDDSEDTTVSGGGYVPAATTTDLSTRNRQRNSSESTIQSDHQPRTSQQSSGTSHQRLTAKSVRARVITEEFSLREKYYARMIEREEELHKLRLVQENMKIDREKLLLEKTKLELEQLKKSFEK